MKKYVLMGIAGTILPVAVVAALWVVSWKLGLAALAIALCVMAFMPLYMRGINSLGPLGRIGIKPVLAKYNSSERQGETIFYGPSNFRLWADMEEDLKPFRVQNHGIGGATDESMMKFADELVFQYKPANVFFQTGSNDYAVGLTVEQAFENKRKMYQMFRDNLPDNKLCVMAGLPLPGRPQFWSQIQEMNDLLRDYCSQYDNMMFVDGNKPLLTEDGQFRPEFYREDGIHLTHEGQLLWAIAIREALEQIDAPRY